MTTRTVRTDCWKKFERNLYGGLIVTPDGGDCDTKGALPYRVISDGALNECVIWFREDQLEPSEQTEWLESQKETK